MCGCSGNRTRSAPRALSRAAAGGGVPHGLAQKRARDAATAATPLPPKTVAKTVPAPASRGVVAPKTATPAPVTAQRVASVSRAPPTRAQRSAAVRAPAAAGRGGRRAISFWRPAMPVAAPRK